MKNKLDNWAENLWGVNGKEGIELLREWYEDIGLPVRLSQIGVNKDDYEFIVNNTIRISSTGSIKQITGEDIIKILHLAE